MATNPEPLTLRNCPGCGLASDVAQLHRAEYRCRDCGMEIAHLDMSLQGVIRGVLGWLRAPGEVIRERYRISKVLGKGGFGATYLVDDLHLNNRHRAIKEVPEAMFDTEETTLLSRLNHPAIPDIIDRFNAEGMVYLVLEFGGTKTLGSERKHLGGKIPYAKLAPWITQLCDVLGYLHAQNPPVVHRDLKPDNVLLDDHERVMLIDFGIAKQAKASEATRTMGRAATEGFSPPEQALGTGTDHRADIYALGATLYYLLTGVTPPGAGHRIAGTPLEAPRALVPELPQAVDAALLRALELNVNLRQQSIEEFRQGFDGGGAVVPLDRARSQRTMLVSEGLPASGAQTNRSIPLPQSDTRSVPVERKGGQSWLPVAAIVAVVLVVGGLAAWMIPQWLEGDSGQVQETPKTSSTPDATPAPQGTQGATTAPTPPSVPATATRDPAATPPAPAPAPTTPATVPSTTEVTPPPTPGIQTAVPGPSAMDILANSNRNQPAVAPPTEARRAVPPRARQPPRKVVSRSPVPRPPPAPRRQSSPWTIIPGQARRTD
ncbi:MAG: serine/threonine-protein kinase [Gammaproteobacteria bacterium]